MSDGRCSCAGGKGSAEPGDRSEEHPTEKEVPCCAPKLALSYEEEAVLRVMRAFTLEARSLRAELRSLPPAGDPGAEEPRRLAITARLEELRRLFREQQRELSLANEEKLRRLGHLP